jgi:hypothetical protein
MMVKHVLVTLTDEQYRCLSYLKGKMGSSDAEVLRNIFLAWISEKTGMGCWREEGEAEAEEPELG